MATNTETRETGAEPEKEKGTPGERTNRSRVIGFVAGPLIGLLIYLLPLLGRVVVAQSDAAAAGIGLVSAGALIGAGLWLENCLRNPDEPEDEDEEEE